MLQYILIIKTALNLLPTIIATIKAIEMAVPESGKGKEKLEIIKTTLENAYKAATDVTVKFETIWPVLSSMISAIVSLLNAAGIFKKKAA